MITKLDEFLNEAKIEGEKKIKGFEHTKFGSTVKSDGYEFGQLVLIPNKIGANIYGDIFRKKDAVQIHYFNNPVKNINVMKEITYEFSKLTDWDSLKSNEKTPELIEIHKKMQQIVTKADPYK